MTSTPRRNAATASSPTAAALTPSRNARNVVEPRSRAEQRDADGDGDERGQEDPDRRRRGADRAVDEIADEGRGREQRTGRRLPDRDGIDELAFGDPAEALDELGLEQRDQDVAAPEQDGADAAGTRGRSPARWRRPDRGPPRAAPATPAPSRRTRPGQQGGDEPAGRPRHRAIPAAPPARRTPTTPSPSSSAISGRPDERPDDRGHGDRERRWRCAGPSARSTTPAWAMMAMTTGPTPARTQLDGRPRRRRSTYAHARTATMTTAGRRNARPATSRPAQPARRWPMCIASSVEVGRG